MKGNQILVNIFLIIAEPDARRKRSSLFVEDLITSDSGPMYSVPDTEHSASGMCHTVKARSLTTVIFNNYNMT